MIRRLDETSLLQASKWLAERDEALAQVLTQYGYPPLWSREPSFATLVHIILEQQVSLASANAAFDRLRKVTTLLTPETFLQLSEDMLRSVGFSRQKITYARHLAESIVRGDLDLEQLTTLPDEEARTTLKRIKGIGNWTADIYLSECLLRPDILPQGDIAMQEAFRALKKLPRRPNHAELETLTEHWRPWRSVGTRMLWHFYLCQRDRSSTGTS